MTVTISTHRRGLPAALATLTLLGCGGGGSAEHAAPAATVGNPVTESALTTVTLTMQAVARLGIEIASVESSTVAPSRTVGGEVAVPPGRAAVVAAPAAGKVLAPAAGDIPPAGASVAEGQSLLRLVALPPDRDLARVQADLRIAESRLSQAQSEAQRMARLFADHLVSARDNERAQADLVAATEARDVAAAQLRVVQGTGGGDAAGLTPLVITAPLAGVVRQVHVAPGQTVAAGTALAEVVDVSRLWIRVPVYAGEAGGFASQGAAMVHGLGATAEGGIRAMRIAGPPMADAAAASVDLYYEVRGKTSLRPGERVGVTVPLAGPGTRGLVVPLAAIVRDANGGSWVYEQRDSVTFIRRQVDVASVSEGRAILSRGPAAGTRIVTAGAIELFGTEFGAGP
jgi:RND family efflux transporter MFP subunit